PESLHELPALPRMLDFSEMKDVPRPVPPEWNATATAYPREATVASLVEEHAARHPDARALAFDGGAWSYGELDRRANRIARKLAGAGDAQSTRPFSNDFRPGATRAAAAGSSNRPRPGELEGPPGISLAIEGPPVS